MNAFLSVAALCLLTGILFVLPLLPAFREMQLSSDAAPLNVIQQHAGEIRYFADSFRTYLQPLDAILQECASSAHSVSGVMPDGTEYLVLGSGNDILALPLGKRDQLGHVLLASAGDLTVSANSIFSRDIYARGRFVGGPNNQYRALLAEYEVHLGQGSSIMRWVHAGGELSAESACQIYGRASSDRRIRLATGCTFLRLNAPGIQFGDSPANPAPPIHESSPSPSSITSDRSLHDGDFEIHPEEVFRGDLVVRGRLRIGSRSRVYGRIKSGKEMVVESGAQIAGSLICATKLLIGPDCTIRGPVISEREVHIEAGTSCGTADAPTTVSAPRIDVRAGVVVFGSAWAREHGEVLASS
ncbi:MAG TPA: polymer-forming cytoskeletal protein [Terriglobales bacterium]|nr:polymer-forming cytoskeletal protein [Terriglobales bacterium]